jgi:hypothetical protein
MDVRGSITSRELKEIQFHSVLTWFVAQRTSLEKKLPILKADHSFPSSAEVKNVGDVTLLPHMPSWHIKLH